MLKIHPGFALGRAARLALGILLSLFCCSLHAGLLVLNNGDRITGELVGIGDGSVTWRSPLFGDIRVPQINVESMDSRGLFEVELDAKRQLTGCQVQSVTPQQLLNCEQGLVGIDSWRLVRRASILPLIQRERIRTTGYASVVGRSSRGNIEEDKLDIDTKIQLRRNEFRNTLLLEYDWLEVADANISDRRRYRYEFDVFFSQYWYYNSNISWERDRYSDLKGRAIAGMGLGYQFFDTELLRLSLQGGPAYINEHFERGADRELRAFHIATDFRLSLNRFGLEFYHRNNFLFSTESGDDWEVESDTGFKLPIIGRLSAVAELEFDYDNMPAQFAKSDDEVWSVGLSYDW